MSDFELIDWKRLPADGELARAIRRSVRMYRRERGRGGHRFHFDTLKSVWAAEDIHVVLSHRDDPVWQRWYSDPLQGWVLVDWFDTRRQAQASVEMVPFPKVHHGTLVTPPAGLYVIARWPGPSSYTMRVRCSSEYTAEQVEHVFKRLGCIAQKDVVAISA